MKILFAADMSFNYTPATETCDGAAATMAKTAKIFREADFSVVNLENIFGKAADHTPIPKSGPNLISSEDFIAYIDALSPTAVGLANNHTKDYGEAPMMNTIALLKSHGYQVFGAGKDIFEAYRPAVFEKDGVKVAVIAVCENEFGTADRHTSGTAGYRLSMVTAAIRKARADGALPVIYFHGGNERYSFPSPGKVELYRHFVDVGAAAVIAMHTHCPQGYEMYEGAPIVYSMGNFFFPWKENALPSWYIGYMSLLDITEGGITLSVIPYKFTHTEHLPLEGEELAYMEGYLARLCAPIADPDEIERYFDGWCTIEGLGHYIKDVAAFEMEDLDGEVKKTVAVKNIFSCEAHDELIRRSFRIVYEGRRASAAEAAEEIRALQQYKY